MRRTKLVTEDDLTPAGMLCPYCLREFHVGDEMAEYLEGMVDDVPLLLSGVCPKCADAIDEHGLSPCYECMEQGSVDDNQCQNCHGAGEIIG